ncbi:uncharacterized protein LOC110098430 [Dendrobium catenatum]|uniref:Uncharacterized protein n=1 Tax=Dendrobium catenatum TaxID=906689 RepID=A0A2I0XF13_9ASPA|nr:uncharacterized protein LOC110098430 [Dendrobium catenatum]PKU86490.1 hypothetical protein MA16_Dca010526 [Dendrobium catenatum]
MASVSSTSGSEAAAAAEGPVLSLMNKRLRALRKKYNRILQMEASLVQGKTLNKEQEEVLRSKPGVVALIDEYDKLRLPLAAAVQEEVALAASCSPSGKPNLMPVAAEDTSSIDSAVDSLLALLYFGCLFDVKPQSEFTSMMLTRNHERGCCLTYDYVTDEATELLGEKDLDMISTLGGLVTSRPLYSGISHRSALEGCIQHAKLWLEGAQEPIISGSSVTYAGLREKLNKIMVSDYYTTTPEMKAPVDVAAAVGKYNAACQMLVSQPSEQPPDGQSDAVQVDYHQQEDEQEDIQAAEVISDQSGPACETQKDEVDDSGHTAGDDIALHQEQQIPDDVEEYNQRDYEQEDQQYILRRSYPNQRGGRGGGGRRGYSNARGRNGRGNGGGYQNGRNQYYDPAYHPRSYYNTRGRGGRPGDSAMYKPQGPSGHDNHDP